VTTVPDELGASQLRMIHRLPKAEVVDRFDHLGELADGRRVIHLGFVDAGFQELQMETGTWLHGRLAERAKTLVGVDIDEEGVAEARRRGFEAHVADCRTADALAAIDIEPAEVVIAGEIIEHLDDPGGFLDAMHVLVAPDGLLVLTTPNASGLMNSAAALIGTEVNHPDHVVLFSWRTLTNLLARHGWNHASTSTFVPILKRDPNWTPRWRLMGLAARMLLAVGRVLGRLGAPFVADGLIVECRPAKKAR